MIFKHKDYKLNNPKTNLAILSVALAAGIANSLWLYYKDKVDVGLNRIAIMILCGVCAAFGTIVLAKICEFIVKRITAPKALRIPAGTSRPYTTELKTNTQYNPMHLVGLGTIKNSYEDLYYNSTNLSDHHKLLSNSPFIDIENYISDSANYTKTFGDTNITCYQDKKTGVVYTFDHNSKKFSVNQNTTLKLDGYCLVCQNNIIKQHRSTEITLSVLNDLLPLKK